MERTREPVISQAGSSVDPPALPHPPPLPRDAGSDAAASATSSRADLPGRTTPLPAAPSRRAMLRLRRPYRRILRAYRVTVTVALSYLLLSLLRRFRSDELHARRVEEAHRRNARRIELAVVELQGLFIKVGQLISIMANFLPAAFREELEALQDNVPPRPYADIEARVREEFGGRSPTEVFAAFDPAPVASASIGQVHVARLASGEKVAVKVQYPGIEEIVRVDLTILRRIFWLLRLLMPSWGFDTIYREVREMLLAELDYRKEAQAIATISGNFAGRQDVLFPTVKPEYSTARVLTIEWMDGIKVATPARLVTLGVDRQRAARLFVEAYCQQIFVDGLYHADPHPGNLLIRPADPRTGAPLAVVFLDFGATGRVSERMRRGMISFLQGAMTRDTTRIIAAMKDMGFISRRADPAVFDRVVEYFHERFGAEIRLEGLSLRDIRLDTQTDRLASLLDLREMNVSLADLRDAFHVPKEWVLLERALLLLLGVCTTLDPEMNPTGIIMPYLERFLIAGPGRGGRGDWSDAAMQAVREAGLATLALPNELGRFLTHATRGELEVRVRGLEDETRMLYALGHQLLWALLALAGLGFALAFGDRGLLGARRLALGGAGLSALLFLWALARGRSARRRRRV